MYAKPAIGFPFFCCCIVEKCKNVNFRHIAKKFFYKTDIDIKQIHSS